MIRKLLYHPFFIKLFNWEYWPFHLVYTPVYLYWMWLALKARSFFFFAPSNPSIRYAGFMMESKKEIYDLMPEGTYPKTLFVTAGTSLQNLSARIEENKFLFPLIAKPDIGLKGHSVKKLNNAADLSDYLSGSTVDFLIQEFISYENEVGIFYYRYPHEKTGHISGIVKKEFLQVTGDGVSTIKELLYLNKRSILQIPALEKAYGSKLDEVPDKHEDRILVPYGNHIRGAKFTDISDLADDKLEAMIDQLCRQVNGFYFGRLDIRYAGWEELKAGRSFSVIELNGAGSEPTHIYDPKHSLFFAWKEITRHLNILYRISKINHDADKRPYLNLPEGLSMFKENKLYMKRLNRNSIH